MWRILRGEARDSGLFGHRGGRSAVTSVLLERNLPWGSARAARPRETAPVPDLVLSGGLVLRDGAWVRGRPGVPGRTRSRTARRNPVPRSSTCPGASSRPGSSTCSATAALGIDVTRSPERLWELAAELPRWGVTAWLPTVVTAPVGAVDAALRRRGRRPAGRLAGRGAPRAARRGPVPGPAARGAHPEELLRAPDARGGGRLVPGRWRRPGDAGAGAAGRPRADRRAGRAGGGGVARALGGDHGAGHGRHRRRRHAGSPTSSTGWPRSTTASPGLPGVALTDERIHVGLIADGVHVAPHGGGPGPAGPGAAAHAGHRRRRADGAALGPSRSRGAPGRRHPRRVRRRRWTRRVRNLLGVLRVLAGRGRPRRRRRRRPPCWATPPGAPWPPGPGPTWWCSPPTSTWWSTYVGGELVHDARWSRPPGTEAVEVVRHPSGVVTWAFPFAGPDLVAAVTTRHGGTSEGAYASCNLGGHVGDDPARVRGQPGCGGRRPSAWTRLTIADQQHGRRVAVVDAGARRDRARPQRPARPAPRAATDALVTARAGGGPRRSWWRTAPRWCWSIRCGERSAVAHAGRRGAVLDVLAATIDVLRGRGRVGPGRPARRRRALHRPRRLRDRRRRPGRGRRRPSAGRFLVPTAGGPGPLRPAGGRRPPPRAGRGAPGPHRRGGTTTDAAPADLFSDRAARPCGRFALVAALRSGPPRSPVACQPPLDARPPMTDAPPRRPASATCPSRSTGRRCDAATTSTAGSSRSRSCSASPWTGPTRRCSRRPGSCTCWPASRTTRPARRRWSTSATCPCDRASGSSSAPTTSTGSASSPTATASTSRSRSSAGVDAGPAAGRPHRRHPAAHPLRRGHRLDRHGRGGPGPRRRDHRPRAVRR